MINDQESAKQPYDIRISMALRRIMRSIDIYSRKLRSDYKITGPQLICLLCIVEKGPMTLSGISKAVHLSSSTLVGILDRLEEKELIRRERSKQDRRRVNITATQKGIKVADDAPSPLQDKLSENLKQLSEEKQAAIAFSLEQIVEMMEVGHIDVAPILETGPPQ